MRLHIPLQRLQNEITSSEFVEYIEALEQDINDFHREDYFLAQIAVEVRRSYAKQPGAVKLKAFMHKFTTGASRHISSSIEKSKAFWKAATGIKEA